MPISISQVFAIEALIASSPIVAGEAGRSRWSEGRPTRDGAIGALFSAATPGRVRTLAAGSAAAEPYLVSDGPTVFLVAGAPATSASKKPRMALTILALALTTAILHYLPKVLAATCF